MMSIKLYIVDQAPAANTEVRAPTERVTRRSTAVVLMTPDSSNYSVPSTIETPSSTTTVETSPSATDSQEMQLMRNEIAMLRDLLIQQSTISASPRHQPDSTPAQTVVNQPATVVVNPPAASAVVNPPNLTFVGNSTPAQQIIPAIHPPTAASYGGVDAMTANSLFDIDRNSVSCTAAGANAM